MEHINVHIDSYRQKVSPYICNVLILVIMIKYFQLQGVLAGILFLIFFSGCSSQKKEKETVKSVKTDTVRIYGESSRTTFPGKIRAASDMSLSFRVSGPILRVYVDVGSYVRKGQVLAQIDPRDYEIQLAATKAEYQQIKNETARLKELYEKQSIAPNDYDKALYGLEQISAKYDAHKNALADTRLLAPSDGYIQKKAFRTRRDH